MFSTWCPACILRIILSKLYQIQADQPGVCETIFFTDHFFHIETETETWQTQSQGWDWDWDFWLLVSKVETETFGCLYQGSRLRLFTMVSNIETETFHFGLKNWDRDWDVKSSVSKLETKKVSIPRPCSRKSYFFTKYKINILCQHLVLGVDQFFVTDSNQYRF